MTLRDAKPSDFPEIAAIQATSPEAAQWNPAQSPDYGCVVAQGDHAILGFVLYRELVPGECEVLNLAVVPTARRQGVARNLLTVVLQKCPGTWFLEVRGSNYPALQLYERAGFLRSGERKGYYKEPAESAIVMTYHS